MKDAEDILQEKELDYLRGFLDCATLLNNEVQAIPHPIPAPKLFDTVHSRIEDAYSIAAELYDEELKKKLGIFWSTSKDGDLKMETWQGIKLTTLTKQLVDKYCAETGENPEDVLQKASEQFLQKQSLIT